MSSHHVSNTIDPGFKLENIYWGIC